MDLYEALGVDKNATQEEIQKAWRSKARDNHPDKGGDINKMMEINRAYNVLKNPSSRDHYDRTGEEPQSSLKDDGVRILMNHFLKVLQEDPKANYVTVVSQRVSEDIAKLRADHHKGQQIKEAFTKRRHKVKLKRGKKDKLRQDLWKLLVDEQIRNVERGLAACEADIKRQEQALELLRSFEGEEIEVPVGGLGDFGSISIHELMQERQRAFRRK